MQLDRHYTDARLVDLYDIDNKPGAHTDFYIRLAAELEARFILDLGCGTGSLTRQLTANGRRVIGVDPSPTMLAVACRGVDADKVEWIEGDSSALGTSEADLVIMSGNVAQVFLEDSKWAATLRALHTSLLPGGHLAFESRNPGARAWEEWKREATYEQIDSPHGPMECWLELVNVSNGRVRFEGHNVFSATGEVLVAASELRFRSLTELTDSLISTGFVIEHVCGDWDYGPVTDESHVMVFIARRI